MCFFKVTIIIFIEYSQPSIFSTVLYIFMTLKFAAIICRTPVTMKQTRYHNSYTFRAASIMLEWEQPLEAASFSQKDFFQNT